MKIFALLALTLAVATACDDNTDTLGGSLTSAVDRLVITTDTFTLSSRSLKVDSVLARNTTSYLGTIRDPETGEYISAHYMTQFHTLENYIFPDLDSLVSRDERGDIIADSCELRLYWSSFYGDSLSSMKCCVHELKEPMREDRNYYSNFDPIAEGYVRSAEDGGIEVDKSYTLEDMNVDRDTRDDTYYSKNIRVLLNDPYTDQNGNTYNNYGTYIMRQFYPEYGGSEDNFKNSVRMLNVIPGFYVESTAGLGNMAEISLTQLNLYFRYQEGDNDTIYVGTTSFAGTQEVLQRTNYVNETGKIDELVGDNSCSYLKTPAGIFTEVTIPVEDICDGHENDTINSVKFTMTRINNEVKSEYSLDIPQTVLLLPKDSLYSFFENRSLANYRTSYLYTYDSSENTYVFYNIATMVREMQHARQSGNPSEDWNKAVIIPVSVTYNSLGALSSVVHNMSLTSTRVVGGPENPYGDIRVSVIYSRYE